MSNEIEGQSAAACIIGCTEFDIEARILQDIEWCPPRDPWEPLISRRDALLPQFNSETVASQISIGIWNIILGYLEEEPETLGIAEEVCRGWYPTSHRLKTLRETRIYYSKRDIHLYAHYIKTVPLSRRVARYLRVMSSGAEQGKQTSLAHLGTFAAMLAGGHLPRLSSLRIEHGEWTPGAIPHSVFLHLSAFHSVTYLTLYDITLPSITVLLRLVCALDGLMWLYNSRLRFLDRQPPPANRRWAPSPALKNLRYEWPDEGGAIGLTADLETSSGHALVQFLLKAANCLNVKQLLRHAGQALHQLELTWLSSPLGGDQHGVQPLDASNIDLAPNLGLVNLTLRLSLGNMSLDLLEQVETYKLIQQIVSSASPAILENIKISLTFPRSVEIRSHVLLTLCEALGPLDHLFVLEKYTSLKLVELTFIVEERSKRLMEADWIDLAPIWFPNLYSRGIVQYASQS